MTQDAIAAAIAAAAAQTPNMNEAQKGGGEWTPPAAGKCLVTLIGYIELGIQHVPASKTDPIKFPAKDEEQVDLIFELSGKGHEPKEIDGKFYPERITVNLKKSLSEKAWFYKIFKVLNWDNSATHFAQLVGRHFLATVVHTKGKGDKVWAGFKLPTAQGGGYTFAAPTYNPVDPETQMPDVTIVKEFPKPRVYSEPRVFLWDYASREMWDSLYIDGMYDERKDDKGNVISPARSKNVIQNKIKAAKNFPGSPVAAIIGDEVLNVDTDDMALGVDPDSLPDNSSAAADEDAALAALGI
jgi:hypothetical protein